MKAVPKKTKEAIIRAVKNGEKQSIVASRFGVSPTTVSNIVNAKENLCGHCGGTGRKS